MPANPHRSIFIPVSALIIGAIVLHLALYWLPLVNQEWVFIEASRYFDSYNQDYLDRYFALQANTLGIPYLAYWLYKLLPIVDIDLAPRLIAILGFMFLGSALVRLNELTGKNSPHTLLIITVFLNPLIWVFGGRGTADFFPAALALFSLSLFWDNKQSSFRLFIAILLFGVAIALKYHAILLLPLIWLEASTRPSRNLETTLLKMTWITCAILVIPALYIYTVKQKLGFWLTPPMFQDTHRLQIDFSFTINNFIGYMGYLTLLLFPFSVFPVWERMKSVSGAVKTTAFSITIFLAGYFILKPSGELNFGPLDSYLNSQFINGIFCLFTGAFILLVKDGINALQDKKNAQRIFSCILLGIVIFVSILSLTRPAQRYLLFILPFGYLFASHYLGSKRFIYAAVIGMYIIANVYITASQYATGQASLEITRNIIEKGLIDQTDPGVIIGHTGNYFPVNMIRNKRYVVVAGQKPKQLFYAESSPVFFVRKTFSVVPK